MPANGPRPKPSVPAAPPDLKAIFSSLTGRRHVALAVSGGSDSMALMRLIRDWRDSEPEPPLISVLTVDHGLRAESAAEARQVGQWASHAGLAHHTLVWTGPKPASGLQAKARAARYDLMAAWCRAHEAEALLTAHTFDDQAETVLMRLARTTSPDSLSGIPRHGQWDGVPLFRPLLSERRDTLRDYLRAADQGWIDDPSNADPRFERVRLRQSLWDLAASGVTPERLVALGETSARTASLLDRCAGAWIDLWLDEHDAGVCHVPADELLGLPPALQQRILGRIVVHYGGGTHRPEPVELRRLAAWVREGADRCTLAGAILGRRKGRFWVTREAARIAVLPVSVPGEEHIIWDGRFRITAPEGSSVVAAGENPVDLGEGIPIFARRAYPLVKVPEGSGEAVTVTFLRLGTS